MSSSAEAASSSARGKAAELRFLQLAVEMGWDVALPVVEDAAWDALLDQGQGWSRVQVKRCYQKKGHRTINLTRGGKRYSPNDADWLAAVEVESGRVWLVPFYDVAKCSRKRITAKMAQYEVGRTPST